MNAAELVTQLSQTGAIFAQRGWLRGTSGNLSATLDFDPLRLVITASGQDKGSLGPYSFVEVDENGRHLKGTGHPSAETALHTTIVRRTRAGSVLHVHSVWATILSALHAANQGISISGYEMLKGLSGIKTHAHTEWLPILDNSQDYARLSSELDQLLAEQPQIHGVLLRAHGLYTWGADIAEAQRHVEIIEFLLEVLGQTRTLRNDLP